MKKFVFIIKKMKKICPGLLCILILTLISCSTIEESRKISNTSSHHKDYQHLKKQLEADSSNQKLAVINKDEGIYITKDIHGKNYLNKFEEKEKSSQLKMLATGNDDLIRVDYGRFYISPSSLYNIKKSHNLPNEIIYISPKTVNIFRLNGTYYFENKKGFAYRGVYKNGNNYIVFTVETRFNPNDFSSIGRFNGNIEYGILSKTTIGAICHIGKYVDKSIVTGRIASIIRTSQQIPATMKISAIAKYSPYSNFLLE